MRAIFAATWWFGQIAVEAAWNHWSRWESNHKQASPETEESDRALLEATLTGASAVEMDLRVNSVGVGGLPNSIGEVELDGAVMEGRFLNAGGVANIKRFVPVALLAQQVMEKTRHIMMAGEGAERFAIQQGFEPRSLLTEESLRRWYAWRTQQTAPQETSQEKVDVYKDFSLTHQGRQQMAQPDHETHDTVGVLGWHDGHLVAVCVTSGMAWKLPGRVGDSPIFGAGLYADDEAGAAVCTGVGEEIWRFTLSARVVENMRRGMTAQKACEDATHFMRRRKPATADTQSAVIAIRKDGDYGSHATQPDAFPAVFCVDGKISSKNLPSG